MNEAGFISERFGADLSGDVNAVLLCITQGNIGLQRAVPVLFSNAEHAEY